MHNRSETAGEKKTQRKVNDNDRQISMKDKQGDRRVSGVGLLKRKERDGKNSRGW